MSFSGSRNNYTISKTYIGYRIVDNTGAEGINTVAGGQSLKFSDFSVNLGIGDKANSMSPSDLKLLIELYVAFFNRTPDADGLSYWIDQFQSGRTINQIADSFYNAAVQYTALTGYSATMSNADFVKVIYKNVLGRSGTTAPPDADVAYWAGELANGHATKGGLISAMLNSAHSFMGDPTWGWVAQLLENKYAIGRYFAVQQGLSYSTAESSISQGMTVAAAVTPSGTNTALQLIGVADTTFDLTIPGPMPVFLPGVSMRVTSPTRIQAEVMEAGYMNNVTLSGTASGNLGNLNGKTIYVVVTDPVGLFSATAPAYPATSSSISVGLSGNQLNTPGRYSGNLKVYVCLDTNCQTQLSGSPALIPFDVAVLPGITVDAQLIAVQSPFGSAPGTQTLTVGLSKYTDGWSASVVTPYNPYLPSMVRVGTGTGSANTEGRVSIEFSVAPSPGTYTDTIRIQSTATGPDRLKHYYSKEITVTYTVSPNGAVDYAFSPSETTVTRKYGDTLFAQIYRGLVVNTGVTLTWHGVEYLSYPPAASGHPNLTGWWSEYPYYGTSICFNTIGSSNCMPPGTYTARVHYVMAKQGLTTDVYYPITLHIVP